MLHLMKRPEVSLQNYSRVYEFYEHYRPPTVAYQLGHRALAQVYKPAVNFDPGAKEAIAQHLEGSTRLILASNHVNNQDQYIVAAMAQRERVMRPMRGRTFIPAKESLFHNPLLRRGVDYMGAIPAFRQKDIDTSGLGDEAGELRWCLQRNAAQRLLDISVARIQRGDHMAIFPEGTRNTGDAVRVQTVKRGIGEIVCGVGDDVPVAIVPMGIYYGEGVDFDKRRPTVSVGNPLEGPFQRGPKLLTRIQTGLQENVAAAVAHHALLHRS